MAMLSVNQKFVFLVAVCAVALIPGTLSVESETNVPDLQPFDPATRNCLSVITKVPGCLAEIYASVYYDRVVIISSPCCKAINKLRHTNCNPQIFPPSTRTPIIPPVSKSSCPALVDIIRNSKGALDLDLPGLLPPKIGYEIVKCWSTLTEVAGCVSEIHKALIGGQFKIGGACCKAIGEIHNNCWFVMFPLQPSFPNLLKGFCATASEPSGAILQQLQ